jgi:hypothetical protein
LRNPQSAFPERHLTCADDEAAWAPAAQRRWRRRDARV